MLPDLPELKTDLHLVSMEYVRNQVKIRMPGLNEAPQHFIHEGERTRIVRADGSVHDGDLKRASSEISINFADVPRMSADERKAILDKLAEDMARQISEHAFATLNQTLEEAGQVHDQRGRPLDADGILATLEKLQMDFDEQGRPTNMTVVAGPQAAAHIRREFDRFDSEPRLKQAYEGLIQRKWMDWRDREAARKLVG